MKAIIPKVSALLLVMAALLVSASVAQATEPATVTVTRSGFQIGGLLLYVDGKPFAKLANDESKTFTIAAGDHYLGVPKWGGDISWGTRAERDLFAHAGKHHFYRLRFTLRDCWIWQRAGAGE
jgi:hypothetical protein